MAHGGCCLLVLDLGCDEGVVAGDCAVRIGSHEGAGSIALLILACVGDQPAVKRCLAAAELIDAVGLAVERGGCADADFETADFKKAERVSGTDITAA